MEFSHTDKENPEDFLPNDAAEADEMPPLFTPEAEDFEASSPTQSPDEPISSINDEGTETTSTTITPETTKTQRPKRWVFVGCGGVVGDVVSVPSSVVAGIGS